MSGKHMFRFDTGQAKTAIWTDHTTTDVHLRHCDGPRVRAFSSDHENLVNVAFRHEETAESIDIIMTDDQAYDLGVMLLAALGAARPATAAERAEHCREEAAADGRAEALNGIGGHSEPCAAEEDE